VALVGCTSNTEAQPAPTVTITEEAVAPEPVPNDNNTLNSADEFVNFVKQNGGVYGEVASPADIISLGNSVCNGFANGLSEQEITTALAQALINSDMANDDGARFGAALIVGAKNYLCTNVASF
jgi:hypothetical protein